jgi:hypothetical protein
VRVAVLVRVSAYYLAAVTNCENLGVNRSGEINGGVSSLGKQEAVELERITLTGGVGIDADDISPLVDPTESSTRSACPRESIIWKSPGLLRI